MKKLKTRIIGYFSKGELLLWGISVLMIIATFCLFDRKNYLTLSASLIGATALIFTAKGNPIGQMLMVLFSVLYGMISFTFAYYGEMITYLGMTAPLSVVAIVTWMRNPAKGKKAEVKITKTSLKELPVLIVLTTGITLGFYFILRAFNTANLILSTVSVATSFIAAYFTFRRSSNYALAYAANDVVLICLWILATKENIAYLSVVICFVLFLVNDLYGFINWSKMRKKQAVMILIEPPLKD